MNLDLLNNIRKETKETNLVQNFIKELSEFIGKEKINLKEQTQEQLPILEKILSKRKACIGNENEIIKNKNNIIKEYANETASKGTMYMIEKKGVIHWKNNIRYKNNELYSVLKVENNKIKKIQLPKKELPEGVRINSIYRKQNERYILDNEATKEIEQRITKMAKEILDKQDETLNSYRKEGHLYMVEEKINNSCFLLDLTDLPEYEFEEIDLSGELLGEVKTGSVLIYSDGEYRYYSNDGFEREIEAIKLKK